MEVLKELSWRLAPVLGFHGDRRAVRVGARDHQDTVPFQAMEAGEDVGRQIGSGQVADVEVTVGIGPCYGDMDEFGHVRSLVAAPADDLSAGGAHK